MAKAAPVVLFDQAHGQHFLVEKEGNLILGKNLAIWFCNVQQSI